MIREIMQLAMRALDKPVVLSQRGISFQFPLRMILWAILIHATSQVHPGWRSSM
ncbi:hypothetical protein BGY98DRAFT_992494 [Russula aff. rugulosa BPL654]|nr:hypothetical protein BGY98DRAFT_992494 [Russula aff. rugulosa BPL654]